MEEGPLCDNKLWRPSLELGVDVNLALHKLIRVQMCHVGCQDRVDGEQLGVVGGGKGWVGFKLVHDPGGLAQVGKVDCVGGELF